MHYEMFVCQTIYGSDIIGTFEAAKGYTKPVESDIPHVTVDHQLLEAHVNLNALWKLKRILGYHSLKENEFHPGDMVQVYVKMGHKNREMVVIPSGHQYCD